MASTRPSWLGSWFPRSRLPLHRLGRLRKQPNELRPIHLRDEAVVAVERDALGSHARVTIMVGAPAWVIVADILAGTKKEQGLADATWSPSTDTFETVPPNRLT